MIEQFFNKIFTLTESVISSPTATSSVSVLTTGLCYLTPLNESNQILDINNFGKYFIQIVDDALAVRVGHNMIINTETYGVTAVSAYEDNEEEVDSFKKLILIKNA